MIFDISISKNQILKTSGEFTNNNDGQINEIRIASKTEVIKVCKKLFVRYTGETTGKKNIIKIRNRERRKPWE